MKKYLIIICLCIIICGCGSKKKDNENATDNSDIGNKDLTYSLDITCGDKKATSKVFLGKNYEATYQLFECSNNDLHLTKGEGSYKIDGDNVKLTDNYDETWNIIVSDDTIKITLNNNVQTLTK